MNARRWRRRREREDAPPEPPSVVVWLVNACVHCGGRDVRTYKTQRISTTTIRWHYCRVCGRARWWKSVEAGE